MTGSNRLTHLPTYWILPPRIEELKKCQKFPVSRISPNILHAVCVCVCVCTWQQPSFEAPNGSDPDVVRHFFGYGRVQNSMPEITGHDRPAKYD